MTSRSKSFNPELDEILAHVDNRHCADCGARGPRWASVKIGVFLCKDCAGIHRKLGVHISFVKSTTIDGWKPQHIEVVRQIGNRRANLYYEYDVPAHKRYTPDPNQLAGGDGLDVRQAKLLESWIRAKYEEKAFAPQGVEEPWRRIERGEDLKDHRSGHSKHHRRSQGESHHHESHDESHEPSTDEKSRSRKHAHRGNSGEDVGFPPGFGASDGFDRGSWLPVNGGGSAWSLGPGIIDQQQQEQRQEHLKVQQQKQIDAGHKATLQGAKRESGGGAQLHKAPQDTGLPPNTELVEILQNQVSGNGLSLVQSSKQKGIVGPRDKQNCVATNAQFMQLQDELEQLKKLMFTLRRDFQEVIETSSIASNNGQESQLQQMHQQQTTTGGGYASRGCAPLPSTQKEQYGAIGDFSTLENDMQALRERDQALTGMCSYKSDFLAGQPRQERFESRCSTGPSAEQFRSLMAENAQLKEQLRIARSEAPQTSSDALAQSMSTNLHLGVQSPGSQEVSFGLQGIAHGGNDPSNAASGLGQHGAGWPSSCGGQPGDRIGPVGSSGQMQAHQGETCYDPANANMMNQTPPHRQGGIPPDGYDHLYQNPEWSSYGAQRQDPGLQPPATVQQMPPATGTWNIDPNELERYKGIFWMTDGNQDGFVEGDEARVLLEKSQLDSNELQHIWAMSDVNQDGRLSLHEFVCALHLVSRRRQGAPLPPSLPLELAQLCAMASTGGPEGAPENTPQAIIMQASGQPQGLGGVSFQGPGGVPGSSWGVEPQEFEKYRAIFRNGDRNSNNVLQGNEAKSLLEKSGLPDGELAHIWMLSDVDQDGCLTLSEFVCAIHMVTRRRQGAPLPQTLPVELSQVLRGG